MQFVNNEPEQIEIRKSQNTLIVVGTGMILYSLWSAVKLLVTFFISRKETMALLRAAYGAPEDVSDRALFITLFIMMTIFLILILALRLYIGRSAIAEGRGERRSILYLLLTFLFIISSLATTINSLGVIFDTSRTTEQLGALEPDQSLSAVIIEATSMIMMVQMVISSIKVRRLTGRSRKAGN